MVDIWGTIEFVAADVNGVDGERMIHTVHGRDYRWEMTNWVTAVTGRLCVFFFFWKFLARTDFLKVKENNKNLQKLFQ